MLFSPSQHLPQHSQMLPDPETRRNMSRVYTAFVELGHDILNFWSLAEQAAREDNTRSKSRKRSPTPSRSMSRTVTAKAKPLRPGERKDLSCQESAIWDVRQHPGKEDLREIAAKRRMGQTQRTAFSHTYFFFLSLSFLVFTLTSFYFGFGVRVSPPPSPSNNILLSFFFFFSLLRYH
ncbi:hypothetical protein PUN28_020753 [Cardiocondyla obscurior]|uniref:Uncharacterized protein n=1 Tax=Cardiocondyla obscurior TaxID=286306 RepID=A0AAW2E956_9HYME